MGAQVDLPSSTHYEEGSLRFSHYTSIHYIIDWRRVVVVVNSPMWVDALSCMNVFGTSESKYYRRCHCWMSDVVFRTAPPVGGLSCSNGCKRVRIKCELRTSELMKCEPACEPWFALINVQLWLRLLYDITKKWHTKWLLLLIFPMRFWWLKNVLLMLFKMSFRVVLWRSSSCLLLVFEDSYPARYDCPLSSMRFCRRSP